MKTDRILKGKTDKIYGEVVLREKDAHKAMQETAIQFAEWLKTAPKRKVIGSKGGIIQYHVFTMQEQFEIFNNEE